MKKVLKICSPQLGLNPDSNLGGEVHDAKVIREFSKKGVKVFTYLPKLKFAASNKNISITRSAFNRFPAILFNFFIIPFLFRTYKKEKFEILRVHNPYFVGPGAYFFKLFHPNVKLVATHHLIENNPFFNLINRLTAKNYDAIICVNWQIANWLSSKFKVDKKKMHVVPNGASTSFKPEPKDQNLIKKLKLQDKSVLLFMGLLIPRKNPLFLLKVYENIKAKNNKTALIYCGSGPLKKELIKYINDHSIDDVVFTGVVKKQDKLKYLNLCDLFILPSKNEGMPLVVLEAMSCGKTVIIPKSNYSNTIIENGKDGFTAESFSIQSWEDLITKLLKSKITKKIGTNARGKIISKFQWSKVAVSQLEVLKSTLC